jgi:hypothetical protein
MRRILMAGALAIPSAVVGYFFKQMLDAWGALDGVAAAMGNWLKTHVSPAQAGWVLGLVAAIVLWIAGLWLTFRFKSGGGQQRGQIDGGQQLEQPGEGQETGLADEPQQIAQASGRQPFVQADARTRKAALQALVETVYDARFILPGQQVRVRRSMLVDPFSDSILYTKTGHLPGSPALPDMLDELDRSGLLEEASKEVVQLVRDDWDRISPNAKASVLRLGKRYPFLGLDDFPPLRPDEQELADVKWAVADTVFRQVRAAYDQAMLESGLDLQNREMVTADFARDVEFYALESGKLIRDRIEIDVALIQLSLSGDYHRAENMIRARAREVYSTLLDVVNHICGEFPNPAGMIERLSRPIQKQIDPLLENPMAVGTSAQWTNAVRTLLAQSTRAGSQASGKSS